MAPNVAYISRKDSAAPNGQSLALLELALDDVGDHLAVGPAEKIRREIGAERRDEGDDDAGDDARQRQRHHDQEQRAEMPGAKVEARFDQRFVEPIERGIKRQHHEGQMHVDEPDHHGEIVVEQLERREVAERLQTRPASSASSPCSKTMRG